MHRSSTPNRRAFTLIELLVTVSIIALLITIAVPALRGARRSAKNASGLASIKAISQGLESFRSDNPKGNRRTNGYPSSAFRDDPTIDFTQRIYGAHWLVRYMLGRDLNGYIPRRNVPETQEYEGNPDGEEVKWYGLDGTTDRLDGLPQYVSTKTVKIKQTVELPGKPPGSGQNAFLGWQLDRSNPSEEDKLPVFVDPYGYPILYYVSSSFPRSISTENELPDYAPPCVDLDTSGVSEKLTYIHADNAGFTGSDLSGNMNPGWNFKVQDDHPIGIVCAGDVETPSWANYIHSHEIEEQSDERTLRPVNPDTFLLFSPGQDALYGTADDIKNFE